MDRFNQLKELVASFEKDFEKFYVKDNKTAGVRVRKHMQTLRQVAQDIRNEVQEKKNEGDGE
ncbi:MAG: histone H1 [Armatimonadetes bacterium]|nr:histone H1 [Armatimonadota bacterium]